MRKQHKIALAVGLFALAGVITAAVALWPASRKVEDDVLTQAQEIQQRIAAEAAKSPQPAEPPPPPGGPTAVPRGPRAPGTP